MGIMTIFSDESGFTGPSLTNRDQPYLVLATISFEVHEAKPQSTERMSVVS